MAYPCAAFSATAFDVHVQAPVQRLPMLRSATQDYGFLHRDIIERILPDAGRSISTCPHVHMSAACPHVHIVPRRFLSTMLFSAFSFRWEGPAGLGAHPLASPAIRSRLRKRRGDKAGAHTVAESETGTHP